MGLQRCRLGATEEPRERKPDRTGRAGIAEKRRAHFSFQHDASGAQQ